MRLYIYYVIMLFFLNVCGCCVGGWGGGGGGGAKPTVNQVSAPIINAYIRCIYVTSFSDMFSSIAKGRIYSIHENHD